MSEDPINHTSDPVLATEQYLTLRLADVTYALPVAAVREIRGMEHITPVPGSAAAILGVMNLRGHVIPIMDLRLRMGLPEREHDRLTVIVLLQQEARVVGLVVDAVSDVIDIEANQIGPVPELGESVDQTCLAGMATIQADVVLTLCVEAVLDSRELEGAQASRRAGAA